LTAAAAAAAAVADVDTVCQLRRAGQEDTHLACLAHIDPDVTAIGTFRCCK
jgi:hypothetical protein